MTKRLLTQHGYCVTSAYSGSEALLLIEKGTFDLILLDLIAARHTGGNSIGKDEKHDGYSDYRCVR